MQHKAKKKFGQNFLINQHIIGDIIAAIAPKASDNMVEVGPGLGALTRPLLQHLPHLHVLEIDRDIIAHLQQHYPADRLSIHAGDALQFDFASLPTPLRIVGNLPYNISSPLLFHFAAYRERIIDMHFMLQKEVVERMVAAPDTPEYGRLSVMLQYRFNMEKLLDVPPDSFRPAPKVDSAVVRLLPLADADIVVKDEANFAKLVTAAFGQRRKTLRNTLRPYLDEADFQAAEIDPQRRAETLSVMEFSRLTERYGIKPRSDGASL